MQRLREFNIILDDVSIVDLVFGTKFRQAIEEKQIAEQEAQKAQYTVGRAEKKKNEILVKASGEAKAAIQYGKAFKESPTYLELKRIETAKEIANILSRSNNKVYIDAETLLLNLTHGLDANLEPRGPVLGNTK